jgi:peptide/nickel transport system permease protein
VPDPFFSGHALTDKKYYLLYRLLQAFYVFIGVTTLCFVLLRLIPGDPCRMIHGRLVPEATIEQCQIEHGFQQPIGRQYLTYLGGLVTGEALAGHSLVYRQPAVEVLLERILPTLFLILYSGLLSVLIALPLGIGAVLIPSKLFDRLSRGTTAIALTLPAFWIGLVLIDSFSLKLHIFPASGYGQGLFGHLYHLFLPALTLAIANGALLARMLRLSLLEVASAPHVLAARAKGLSFRRVFVHHVLRNGLISPITLISLQLAWMMSGTVVVEHVFAIPGLGALLVQSILQRDYILIQLSTLLFAVIVTAVSLLTDLAHPLLDPRVQYD